MKQYSAVKDKQLFKWFFNLKEKSLDCDPLLSEFLGFSANKKLSIGLLLSCFPTHQVSIIKSAFKRVLSTQQGIELDSVINTPDHRYLVKLSIFPTENRVGSVEGVIEYLQNFPKTVQENEFLREIFLHSDNGRMLATSNHIIIMANKAFCDQLGYQQHELIGKSAKILKSGHYQPEFYKKLWETVDTLKVWRGELLAKNKMHNVCAREVQIQRFELDGGDHFYFSNCVKLDLPSSALHSNLTIDNSNSSIPNKVLYTQSLQQSFASINNEQTLVVATFKINWLQTVSDFTACWLVSQRFQLIKQFGTLGLISEGIYSIYWVEEKKPDKIDALLRQLLKVFSHGFDDSGFDLFSTINIGASILLVDAKNPTQLISHSTQTLIANPVKAYSSLYYFDRRLANRFGRYQVLAKLLKKALNEQAVEVYYQPIVAIPSLQIEEFEALFRIQLDTELEYEIQELISIAEANNWINEIDTMVTKIALNALPDIQKHYQDDNIAIAINRSLANDRITHCCLEDTIDILLASNADLSKVTIELTESAVFENFQQQKKWVEKLQEYGVKVAIDDFGTGYSSFAYLSNLPVNFIKIDRSFVTDLTLDSNEYAMIEMLCKLAHKIGAKVIAEGVETVEELSLLSRAKVDLLQGYIFSRPLSLENILTNQVQPYPDSLSEHLYQRSASTLGDICIKAFERVELDDRLSLIREKLVSQAHEYFLVIENKRCVGIVYSRDYYAAISPYIDTEGEHKRDLATLDKRAHQIMKKEFMVLDVDSDIKEAEQYFSTASEMIIVINDHHRECIGITTVQALLTYQCAAKNR
ncbi:EAL domain-containing protein [Psychromonas marina]|nr:EAL domain-containing protein [Psychromonas marina]